MPSQGVQVSWGLVHERWKMKWEMGRRFGVVAVVMQVFFRAVVERKESSRKAIYWSVSVLTLTYGHELHVVTERTRSWIQVAKIRYLLRVAGLSLRDWLRTPPHVEGVWSRDTAPLSSKGPR